MAWTVVGTLLKGGGRTFRPGSSVVLVRAPNSDSTGCFNVSFQLAVTLFVRSLWAAAPSLVLIA